MRGLNAGGGAEYFHDTPFRTQHPSIFFFNQANSYPSLFKTKNVESLCFNTIFFRIFNVAKNDIHLDNYVDLLHKIFSLKNLYYRIVLEVL